MWMMVVAMVGYAAEVEVFAPGDLGIDAEEGVSWTAANGRNVLSWSVQTRACETGAEDGCEQTTLAVQHHVEHDGLLYRLHTLEREVACSDDGGLRFWRPRIRDLDADGVDEVVFGVEMGCSTDLVPRGLDLHVWEGMDQHSLHGQTSLDDVSTPPTLSGSLLEEPVLREGLLQHYAELAIASEEQGRARSQPVDDLRDALDGRVEVDLGELVRASSRRDLLQRGRGPTTRVLRRCDRSPCYDDQVLPSGAPLVASRLFDGALEGDDVRTALLVDHASPQLVSGYAGATVSTRGAAHATNELACFTVDASTGRALVLDDVLDTQVVARLETLRRQDRSDGLGDPLAGYHFDTRSFRVDAEGRVHLCAVASTTVTEGRVYELVVGE